jgi:protein TonB
VSHVLRSSGVTGRRLGVPITLSLGVHVALVVLALWTARPSGRNAVVYSVNLIAAPAGPRQIGIVKENVPTPEKDAPLPKRAEVQPRETVPVRRRTETRRTTSPATQTPAAKSARFDTPAPKAGGGEQGGTGTDVANIRTGGQQFPFPAYLTNIVNQIAMRFDPRQQRLLKAEVQFVIRRDGSVMGITIVKGSGSYGFDVEAKGAVEAAANAGAFGPLPDGFSDDALTVIFEFSPSIIR